MFALYTISNKAKSPASIIGYQCSCYVACPVTHREYLVYSYIIILYIKCCLSCYTQWRPLVYSYIVIYVKCCLSCYSQWGPLVYSYIIIFNTLGVVCPVTHSEDFWYTHTLTYYTLSVACPVTHSDPWCTHTLSYTLNVVCPVTHSEDLWYTHTLSYT